MRGIALGIVCVSVLLGIAGCDTAFVVGDKVMGFESGKFVYHDGSLQANYRYPLDRVWEAARKTVTDLKATDVDADRRIEKGTIDAFLYEEKVKIVVEYLTREETTVSIRVGTSGSTIGAKFLHDKLEENLKK